MKPTLQQPGYPRHLRFLQSAALLLAGSALLSCSSAGKLPAGKGPVTGAQAAVKDLPASAKKESKTGYRLPNYEEKKLANGLTILYVPDDKLPYVSYSLLVRAGAVQDPEGLSGLAAMVSELLDKGTKKRNATQIANDLGLMGAEFDASASMEHTLISASGLSMQAEPLLKNLLEIVLEPTFSEKEVERVRKQLLSSIERRVDSPEAFTDLAFDNFLYGSHPYARAVTGNLKSVAMIKKKNIIQHYLHYYRPNNAILAVVGKYSPELAAKIEAGFGSWQAREVPKTNYPQVAPIAGVQIELIDKPGAVQAQIKLGNLGIARANPDYIAIRVANTILGGAFASRLSDRVRKELGLTYSIGSSFDARLDRGPFEISTFTKNVSVGQTVSESLKVLTEFREKGVTQFEVDMTKGYLKGVFPANIETAEKLAFNLMLLRFYGIPDSYLTNYLDEVDRLTAEDIDRVVKRYVDDKNLKVVVYTNASEASAQLEPIAKSYGGELLLKKPTDVQ